MIGQRKIIEALKTQYNTKEVKQDAQLSEAYKVVILDCLPPSQHKEFLKCTTSLTN